MSDPFVTGLGITQRVRDAIGERDIATEVYATARASRTRNSAREVIEARPTAARFDGFVGVGGGSALDTAKIAALFATHGGELLDYVNKPIGQASQIPGPVLPLVAVPTTAGTGSEATSVAILDFPSLGVKTGISHRYLRPRVAIVDPLLLEHAPAAVIASCGLDVVCHAVESYTAMPYDTRERTSPDERPPYQGSNPVSDMWSGKAIQSGGRYLRRAVADASDLEARGEMMLAATLAGIGFGNAGVHVPHACAYPIASLKHAWTPTGYPTSHAFVPHGFSVTVTAPASFRFTQEAAPERHREAARMLTGDRTDDLGEAFASLMQDVGAPMTIGELGYDERDIPALVEGAMKQQRLLVNAPKPVDEAALGAILRDSL